jgi:hypothetical protein
MRIKIASFSTSKLSIGHILLHSFHQSNALQILAIVTIARASLSFNQLEKHDWFFEEQKKPVEQDAPITFGRLTLCLFLQAI